ncbi:hypothetical protein SAMN05444920_12474 [Nonomuraea solani]|uniref:Uncharacterized protein n=1 Tax=Nonomuraea solani TaxID=1144553 RepID=A0A1H6EZ51_9ACTN|nr:hypothetical protein [Nonomuraea solani]SEH02139.1 hypothetical protein SAMN05444920_12474 [Nonomuraea solani]
MDIALFVVFLALALSVATLVLFVVLVAVIRAEDRRHAPTGTLSRRLLGTYARRPTAYTGRR